jgi:hypothetical protein
LAIEIFVKSPREVAFGLRSPNLHSFFFAVVTLLRDLDLCDANGGYLVVFNLLPHSAFSRKRE